MIDICRKLPLLALVLCAFAFAACQEADTADVTAVTPTETNAPSGLNIVYIRLDSLQTGYVSLAEELARLEDNARKAEENITKMAADLERDVRNLQNRAQQGLMTPKQMRQEEQRIGNRQQEIVQQRDIALGSVQQEQGQLLQTFSERLKEVLEELKEENGYDFILNEGNGSGLLMGDDAYDITGLVLERLNAEQSTEEEMIEVDTEDTEGELEQ